MAAVDGWVPLKTNFTYIDIPLLTDIATDISLIHSNIQQVVAPLPTIDLTGGMAMPLVNILPLFNSIESAVSHVQYNAQIWSEYKNIGWNSTHYLGGNTWYADGSNELYGTRKGKGVQRMVSYLNELYDVYYNRLGVYGGFNASNRNFNAYGTQIYIRQPSSNQLYVRFVSEYLKKEFVTIEWYFTVNNTRYRIYTNNRNGSTHEYFWYGEVGTNKKLTPGSTDWYFDTKNGAVDLLLDLNSIVGITAAKGFLIPTVNYYQGESWNRLQSINVNSRYTLGS